MRDPYTPGDVVLIAGEKEVLITGVSPDVKNGQPGWHGVAGSGTHVWGYNTEVIGVVATPKVPRRDLTLKPAQVVLRYLKDIDNTMWFGVVMVTVITGSGMVFLRVMFP
jgi:hypothetical protein